jgi:SAM-dependent MidA family methyltransferase
MGRLLATDPVDTPSPHPAPACQAHESCPPSSGFDLVEAGAGNGRLSADILTALRSAEPTIFERARLHLVEVSAAARAAQASTLGELLPRLASSGDILPDAFEGVLIANELLDALPTHQVVMRRQGLREVFVEARDGALVTCEGPPSTPALAEYLANIGVTLEIGWRVEINLRAVGWVRHAAQRLKRGFIILIDYGHDARELYSAAHASGTLTSYGGGRESCSMWLAAPGKQDLTAHVDFTSVRQAAEAEGITTLAFLDQTYFLMGLAGGRESFLGAEIRGRESFSPLITRKQPGLVELKDPVGRLENDSRPRPQFNQFKTLIMPGGLGSTMKVLLLGKGVGTPALRGTSYRVRVT